MMRHCLLVIVVSLLALITVLPEAMSTDKNSPGASIWDFKAQSLYRAVKLNWMVKAPLKKGSVFQILRSDGFVEGPYEKIANVPHDEGKGKYTYLDKSPGVESTYYYKLVVMETGETYGPISARPYFSPPAT